MSGGGSRSNTRGLGSREPSPPGLPKRGNIVESELRPLSLMLVDDHALVREGVRAVLSMAPGYQVKLEAASGKEALERLMASPVDIVLMDVSMPGMDGIEAAAQLRRQQPDIRTLMLSMHATEGHARRALEAGARGYCTKEGGKQELLAGLAAVRDGRTFVSPPLTPAGLGESGSRRLTRRQTQILELIALSYTSKEIARHLTISMKTVESHRTALMRQLDLHDLAGLVRYAIKTGLVGADACPPPRNSDKTPAVQQVAA